METKVNYSFVLSELIKLRETVVDSLKSSKNQELVNRKTEIDWAIRWLERGQEFNAHPKSRITMLPDKLKRTPSSGFRVIEDCESDNPNFWIEVEIDGEYVRPSTWRFNSRAQIAWLLV